MVSSKVTFRSSSTNYDLEIKCVPGNVAVKLSTSKIIYVSEIEEFDNTKGYIDVILSDVHFDKGKGIFQNWADENRAIAVLSASHNQVRKLAKLNLIGKYISLDIGDDDGSSYMAGSFTFTKDDYPIDSWSIEIPL
jgi:hypothetical protein